MKVSFHDPQTAEAEIMHSNGYGPFCTLDFKSADAEVSLFLRANQMNAARAIADIFNGDIDALVYRIGDAISRVVELTDEDLAETALFVAGDLVGKSFDEALRERREAEDAA